MLLYPLIDESTLKSKYNLQSGTSTMSQALKSTELIGFTIGLACAFVLAFLLTIGVKINQVNFDILVYIIFAGFLTGITSFAFSYYELQTAANQQV